MIGSLFNYRNKDVNIFLPFEVSNNYIILLLTCVEKSKEFVSFKCTCQAHELLLTTESLPITILLGELQQVNLPINDQNGGHLMQSLLIFIGTKVPNSKIMAYTKNSMLPVSCNVIRNGKVYSFNSKADYIVKDYLEKSAKTLAVGEIQSSQITAVGVGNHYNLVELCIKDVQFILTLVH